MEIRLTINYLQLMQFVKPKVINDTNDTNMYARNYTFIILY